MSSLLVSSQAGRHPALWRNRDYMLLWCGQAVSLIGTQISQIAFPLLILAVTHSPVQAGVAGALKAIPYLLLSLPAGALVDRWNRKRVMLLCDSGRAVALLSMPVAVIAVGQVSFVQIALVALAEGTLFVFFNLAQVSCLPRLVSPSQLPTAVARNETTTNLGYLLGPALGGFLFGLGHAVPFLVDGLSYVASVLSLRFIEAQFEDVRAPSTTTAPRLRQQIRQGILWLWRHPALRFLTLLTAVGNLIDFAVGLTIILIARQHHASSTVIGLMLACIGVGGIVGSFLADWTQRRYSFRQLLAGCHWLNGALLVLVALGASPLAIGGLMAANEVAVSVCLVASYTYRLAIVPDALRGRVTSVFRLVVFAGQPLGLALAGLSAEIVGPTPTMLLLAAMTLILAAAATLSPQLRQATLSVRSAA